MQDELMDKTVRFCIKDTMFCENKVFSYFINLSCSLPCYGGEAHITNSVFIPSRITTVLTHPASAPLTANSTKKPTNSVKLLVFQLFKEILQRYCSNVQSHSLNHQTIIRCKKYRIALIVFVLQCNCKNHIIR